ncbi:hypothetical protein BH23ACT12_BH23ACT12_13770 [soil metagenome]
MNEKKKQREWGRSASCADLVGRWETGAVNPTGEPRLSRAWLTALAAVAAYAWAATSLRPFTVPALVVTLLTGFCVLAIGSRLRPAEREEPVPVLPRVWTWIALFGGLAAWELAAFVQLPRADNPTLSSLANQVFDSHLVRALAFWVWIAGGLGIARR